VSVVRFPTCSFPPTLARLGCRGKEEGCSMEVFLELMQSKPGKKGKQLVMAGWDVKLWYLNRMP